MVGYPTSATLPPAPAGVKHYFEACVGAFDSHDAACAAGDKTAAEEQRARKTVIVVAMFLRMLNPSEVGRPVGGFHTYIGSARQTFSPRR